MNFDIRLFLQPKVHQCLDIVLCPRTLYGCDERLPLSRKLAIRRERGDIDKVLDLPNDLLAERRDAPSQGIDELTDGCIKYGADYQAAERTCSSLNRLRIM